MKISVIICTHNPRSDYLKRVLNALERQTLDKCEWELLLIDNGSKQPVAEDWDLTWHPHARHVREDELGLTPARIRGIKEATGDLLVFVDDDNLLDPGYLAEARAIAHACPHIGAFNGGTTGEYEIPIPPNIEYYVRELGDLLVERDSWSNLRTRSVATPIGAGLCVRKNVAIEYADKILVNPLRRLLDRSGVVLLSGGDLDLAWCAVDLGMGTGRFKTLHLQHLISKKRISEDYIVRLYAGYAASAIILAAIRPGFYPPRQAAWKEHLRFAVDYFRVGPIQKRIMVAGRKACKDARCMVRDLNTVCVCD